MFSEEDKTLWGFHPLHESFYLTLKESNPYFIPARVVFAGVDHFKILPIGVNTDRMAVLKGSYQPQGNPLPVVGDWVVVELKPGDHMHLMIHELLPRRSCLKRADGDFAHQDLVSNVDVIALVTSFNQDYNERRIERGLAMIEESGAKPVIVLNKSDLLSEIKQQEFLQSAQVRFAGTQIFCCSAEQREGLDPLRSVVRRGQTLAFLGMSGVGKSTLINALIGKNKFATSAIREEDSRGRHTTTHREMTLSQDGFWIIDNPGIREFSMAGNQDVLDDVFEEIRLLASKCKFGDCLHQSEPGCAVLAALESGELPKDRWDNYLKLKREIQFHLRKGSKALQSETKKVWAKRHKDAKVRSKLKKN